MIPPNDKVDPTQEAPSSSMSNPVTFPRSWGLAALLQPTMLPQLNIPRDAKRKLKLVST